MRVVGFYKDQRDQLAKHNDTPVSLDHCSITKSKFSDFLEVVVNQSMVISASPKKDHHCRSTTNLCVSMHPSMPSIALMTTNE